MRFIEGFKQGTLAGVPIGSIIALSIDDRTTFCMAIANASKHAGGVICLKPGHRLVGDAPGVYEESVVGSQTMVCYSDATVAPSQDPAHLQFGPSRVGWPNGALLLLEDEFYIVAAVGHRASGVWRVRDGTRADNIAADQHTVGFLSWKIMTGMDGAAPHELFTVDVAVTPAA